jgi:hypothetical protein
MGNARAAVWRALAAGVWWTQPMGLDTVCNAAQLDGRSAAVGTGPPRRRSGDRHNRHPASQPILQFVSRRTTVVPTSPSAAKGSRIRIAYIAGSLSAALISKVIGLVLRGLGHQRLARHSAITRALPPVSEKLPPG